MDGSSELKDDEQLPENVSLIINDIQKEKKRYITTVYKQKDIRKYIVGEWSNTQKSSEFQEIYSERNFRGLDKCCYKGTPKCHELSGVKGGRKKLKTVHLDGWDGNYCVPCFNEAFTRKTQIILQKNTKKASDVARSELLSIDFKGLQITHQPGIPRTLPMTSDLALAPGPADFMLGLSPFQNTPTVLPNAFIYRSDCGRRRTTRRQTPISPRKKAIKRSGSRPHRSASLEPSSSFPMRLKAHPKRSRSDSLPFSGGKKKTRRKRKKKKKKTRRKR